MENMSNELFVLLVDDDPDAERDFSTIWQRILSPIWPRVRIEHRTNFDILQEISERRPHIVIFDNMDAGVSSKAGSARRKQDNRGLELISKAKLDFPDSIYILFTNNNLQISSLGAWHPSPDLIVPKTTLPNDDYEAALTLSITKITKRLPVGDINYTSSATAIIKPFAIVARSLIEQCLFNLLRHGLPSSLNSKQLRGQRSKNRPEVTSIYLDALSSGLSGAAVLLCMIEGPGTPGDRTQFVLKLSDRQSIEKEVGAYDSHVRFHLPHHVRVDMVGVGESGLSSAALYAFAFGRKDDVISLTKAIQDASTVSIEATIESLVSYETGGWYVPLEGELTVEAYANNRWEYRPQKAEARERGIRANLARFGLEKDVSIEDEAVLFSGQRYPFPRRNIQKYRGRNIATVICHGDLNSNNVIILRNSNLYALIDFEMTGEDSCFKDFISLEGSIIGYWPSWGIDLDLSSLIGIFSDFDQVDPSAESFQRFLAERDAQAKNMFETIGKVRRAVSSYTMRVGVQSDKALFAFLSTLHYHKLISLDGWSKHQFHRLLARFCASTELAGREISDKK